MHASTWLTLLITFAVAVMSPGPDFLATLRMSLAHGHRHGMATGLGIGVGTSLWAFGTMAGIVALISASPAAFFVVRLLGAFFLAFYGGKILAAVYKSWKSPQDSPVDPVISAASANQAPSLAKAFRLGFLTTTVGNPKAVIFFTTLFASMLPPTITIFEGVSLTVLMVAISSAWFVTVARVAGFPRFVNSYKRLQKPIDMTLGAAFVILGLALVPWGILVSGLPG